MPYAHEQSVSAPVSASPLTSACPSLPASSSTATFATLMPPVSTPSVPLSPSESSPLLVSSAQSSSSDSYLLSAPSSTYYSASSSLPPFSANPSPPITQQSCGTSSANSTTTSLVSAPSLLATSYMNSYHSYSATSDEIFGDIDLSLYDFDIFSPLSPPSAANKSGPIMSAEELIRTVSSTECGSTGSGPTPSLFTLNHYSVSGFSGQTYTSTSYCTSSSSMTNVVSSLTTASSTINSPLMSQTVPVSSPTNCGSSSNGPSLHLHASGRYYKAPEERDQQTVATIKCHN